MGREAYRMRVRFTNPEISKERVVEELLSLGAYKTNEGQNGQMELEAAFDEGHIEMLIYNQREYIQMLFDTMCFEETGIHLKAQETPNITVMEIRFAKADSVDLVDKTIELMQILKERGILKEVSDLEARQTIDLLNYSAFKDRVKKAV